MTGKNSWSDADVARGERLARKLYSELGLRDPLEHPIEAVAWRRGAKVIYEPLDGAQGRLVRLGKESFLTVDSRIVYPARQRFVIAHELGHHELHPSVFQLDVCDESKINEIYDQATEREANAFAAEFLMPAHLWKKHVDVKVPSLDVISALAEQYRVSFTASAIRFVKLSEERCAVAFVKDRRVEWCASSADFGYRIERGHALDTFALAHDYWTKGSVAAAPDEVPARTWLGPRAGSLDLQEHSRPIPSLRAVLSLLWIKPDAE